MTRKTKGKIEIQNFQIIKEINLDLTKNLVIIGGGNGQGKTSVLRAIHACVIGKRAIDGKGSPVRDGEPEGSVLLSLGDIEIVRRFNAQDKWDVVLKRSGKVETTKVQDRLDTLVSKMTFDPSFLWDSKVDEKQRTKMLLEAVGVDFSDLESKRAELYEERRRIGQERDRLKGALDKYPVDFDAPEEPKDYDEINIAYGKAMRANAEKQRALDGLQYRHDQYNRFKHDLAVVRGRIKQLQEEEAQIIANGKAYKAETETITEKAQAMPEFDLETMSKQLSDVAAHNKAYEAGLQRSEFGIEHKNAARRYELLTEAIDNLDGEKEARLKAAKLPLEGLAATEEGVTLNGYPISRACGRDRLTVAATVACAMADKDFPLVCIDGGEQFDSEWLPEIEKIAEQYGVVIVLTRVSKTAECTVIMQDGRALIADSYIEEFAPVSPTDETAGTPQEQHVREAIAAQLEFSQRGADPEDDTMSTGTITGYDEDMDDLELPEVYEQEEVEL